MKKEYALIIGCGKIAAGYNNNSNKIITHAKALKNLGKFSLLFYDPNLSLANEVSKKYKGENTEELTEKVIRGAKWISICSPTETHFEYLSRILKYKDKIVLCEKPITYDKNILDKLKYNYKKINSEVFVNYSRRYLPTYKKLKNDYQYIFKFQKLVDCKISYCKGFLNNASHAFDLLEYLFDNEINMTEIKNVEKEFDYFDNDPTITMNAVWENATVFLIKKPIMNNFVDLSIELEFWDYVVTIFNRGDDIIIKEKKSGDCVLKMTNCIQDYMKYVVEAIYYKKQKNNFFESIKLNEKMLQYLNKTA